MATSNFQIIYPMFAMVLLTFSVLIRLFRARVRAVADGKTEVKYFRVYQGAGEAEESAKLARHFTNLYEAPVLFYACCLAILLTGISDIVMLVMAWSYVALRVVHTFIHTGRNRIGPRARVYFASWIVLLAMWLLLVFRVATLN